MYKKRVFGFLLASFVFGFCPIAIILCSLYEIDPLYLFYNGDKYETTQEMKLHSSVRLQARGIINLYDFDSVILGSSMLRQTSSEYASNVLGGKFINLSMGGSCFVERFYALEYALKKHKIQNVIYSIDSFNKKYCLSMTPPEWANVYSDNFFRVFKIYLQRDFIKFIYPTNDIRRLNTPDKLEQWIDAYKHLFGGMENWINLEHTQGNKEFLYDRVPKIIVKKKKNDGISYKNDTKLLKQSIEQNILYFVKDNPQTNFYFILPPNWRGLFVGMLYDPTEQNNYDFHKEIIKELVQLSAQYKNMFILAFELEPFVDDIKNYCDPYHYHPDINKYMIDCIKEKKNLLTVDNVDEYFKKAEELARNFDIEQFAQEANKILKARNLKLIKY